jgi:hypothetical protein
MRQNISAEPRVVSQELAMVRAKLPAILAAIGFCACAPSDASAQSIVSDAVAAPFYIASGALGIAQSIVAAPFFMAAYYAPPAPPAFYPPPPYGFPPPPPPYGAPPPPPHAALPPPPPGAALPPPGYYPPGYGPVSYYYGPTCGYDPWGRWACRVTK